MNEECLLVIMKNSAAMEDSELQQSPRKRRKTMDGGPNQSDQGATVPAAMASGPLSTAGLPQSSHNEQLSKEAEVGITEFVSPDLPGFSGILKKRYFSNLPSDLETSIDKSRRRYTDFLVNEILPSGQVVHLDNLNLPARRQQEKNRETETPSSSTAGQPSSAHTESPERVAEPISEPAPKFILEAVSVPTSESAPEPVAESASGPDPVPGHSDKAGVTQDELRSADPTAKWQAYANEPSTIQVRSPDLASLYLRSTLSSSHLKMKHSSTPISAQTWPKQHWPSTIGFSTLPIERLKSMVW